jgi:two-component system, NarL family, nitrate/nitrite response regulator NarL
VTAAQKLPGLPCILLVDDHPTFRLGLGKLAESLGATVQGVSGVAEALELLGRGLAFDLILYDWHLPRGGGLRGLLALRDQAGGAAIAVITGDDEEAIGWAALRAKVSTVILKSDDPQAMGQTLARLLGIDAGPRNDGGHGAPAKAQLSPRQADVLALMARGDNDKDIARSLNISHHTVRGHVSDILALLGARNRTHAVLLAAGRGWIGSISPHQ